MRVHSIFFGQLRTHRIEQQLAKEALIEVIDSELPALIDCSQSLSA